MATNNDTKKTTKDTVSKTTTKPASTTNTTSTTPVLPKDAKDIELMRKALTGVKPSDAANNDAYISMLGQVKDMDQTTRDSYLATIAEAQRVMQPTTSKLAAIDSKATTLNTSGTSGTTSTDPYGGFANYNFDKQATIDNMRNSLTGAIESKYNSQQTGYKNALLQAQSDAEIEQRNTTADAADREDTIEDQTYAEMERQKVMGAARGVMSSRQQMASEENVTRTGNAAIVDNLKERDARISDIRTRISSLTNQTNNLITSSKFGEATELQSAQAQAQAYGDTQEMNMKQFAMTEKLQDKSFVHDLQVIDINQDNAIELIEKNHKNTLEQMKVQYGFDVKKIWANAGAQTSVAIAAEQRAIQHALNETIPGTVENIIAVKTFEKSLQNMKDTAAAQGEIDKNALIGLANTKVLIDLQQYAPGTPAYILAQKNWDANVQKYYNELSVQAGVYIDKSSHLTQID